MNITKLKRMYHNRAPHILEIVEHPARPWQRPPRTFELLNAQARKRDVSSNYRIVVQRKPRRVA
jgi:hypothetical protein